MGGKEKSKDRILEHSSVSWAAGQCENKVFHFKKYMSLLIIQEKLVYNNLTIFFSIF